MNDYVRNELGYKTGLKYFLFGQVSPWDRNKDHTRESLRLAMAENPYLHAMVQSGYFDGACDYFDARYGMWQLDPSGKMKDRLSWKGFRSGHMLYLRKPDLDTSIDDLREFIKNTMAKKGQPAKYSRSF